MSVVFCVNQSKGLPVCYCMGLPKTLYTGLSPYKSLKSSQNHCFCRNILLEVKMNMKHIDITIRRIANHCFLIYLFI